MKYTTKFTFGEICDILGIEVPEEYTELANKEMTNVATTLQYLKEGTAFFVLGTDDENKQLRLDRAIAEKAAVVFVGKDASEKLVGLDKIPHVVLDAPFKSATMISARIREMLELEVIGVTGSLGKTTTKDLIFYVLKERFNTERSYRNGNTLHPMLEHLQHMKLDTKMYVQEFGAADINSLGRVLPACIPDLAVITNISDPHLDKYGTRENILKEKEKLITCMPDGCPAFLNFDDVLLRELKYENHPIVSYAIENKNADFYAENLKTEDGYMTFDVVNKGNKVPVKLHAYGEYNVINAVCAFAIGKWYGMTDEEVVRGIGNFKSEGIRQNLVNIGGYHVYLDCYNSAPISLVGAMKVLSNFKTEEGGKRVAVLADIARLGDASAELHKKTGLEISEIPNIDLVLCYGNENAEMMADAIKSKGIKTLYTPDRNQLDQWMRENITRKDITLVKGPVPRLLSKSVDQVFGTALHLNSEHFVEYTEGDFRFKVVHEKEDHEKQTVGIVNYLGEEKAVTLPNSFKGVDVFCVGPKSFSTHTELEEVIIPEPIYNIGIRAFFGCTNLKKIQLPKSLKIIDRAAFRACKSLETVVIPEGVVEIGPRAFKGCSKLTEINLPASLGNISADAFEGCGKVKITCEEGTYAASFVEDFNRRRELAQLKKKKQVQAQNQNQNQNNKQDQNQNQKQKQSQNQNVSLWARVKRKLKKMF